jgi:hypothetical protein
LKFNIVIDLDDRDTLTDVVYHQIELTNKRIEASQRFLEFQQSTFQNAMMFCQGLVGLESFGGAVTAAGQATELAFPGGGGLMVDTGGFVNRLTKEQLKPFVKMCKLLTCQTSFTEEYVGLDLLGTLDDVVPYQAQIAGWLGREKQSDFYDPYKSKYIAYAMQCIPAIIHHMKVEQTIECTYLDCLTSGVMQYGQSVSYCEAERAYSSCVYNTQSILNALPVVNMFRDGAQRFGEAISNPYNLFGFAAPLACSLMPSGPGGLTIAKGACLMPVLIQNLGTFITVAGGIGEQIANFNQVNPATHCAAPMSAADRVISANLQSKTPVGHYPTGFSFDYNQPIAGNLFLRYDGSMSEFALTRGQRDDSPVVGYVSPSQVDFSSGRPTSNSFNVYSGEGRLLGTVDRAGFSGVQVDNYQKLLGDLDRYNAERNTIIQGMTISNPDPFDALKLDAISELIDNTMSELEDHDVAGLEELLRPGVASDVYSNAHSANREKYDSLITMYPFMEYYFEKEWELSQAHRDVRDENQPIIDDLSGAASGIGFFNRNTNVNKELDRMNARFGSECSGDAANSRSCTRLQDRIKAYERARDKCAEHGVKDCTKSNMNSRARDLDKDVSKASREANKQRLVNTIDTKFHDHFGSFHSAIRTAWGVSHGMSMIRDFASAFSEESSDFPRHTALGQASEWFRDVGSGDWGICSANLRPFEQETGGIAVKAGEAGYRAGAYIVARKSAVQESHGVDAYYDYWLEGVILTSKGGDLGYRIYMYGDSGRVDVTELVTGRENPVARRGTPVNFGGLGTGKTFMHAQDFRRVCLEFTTSNLRDYFDVVQISGRSICQNIGRE